MRSNPRLSWTLAASLALMLCFLLIGASPALAQNTITGTVVDAATQQPLAGAQVVIEGTQMGSLTDNRGRFLILNVPQTTVTIEVIMIGYRAATVQASADRPAVIELQPTAIDLDEIVVTGVVGEQQARSIGNSIGKIDAAALQELAPSAAVKDMLSSRVAGVRIMSGGGEVGTGGVTRIRGVKSMTLSAQPIIVVDGVRVNGADNDSNLACGVGTDCAQMPSRLDDFNPDEIESIEIIKGPAAATLYGTEASNGVIQIITKKGVRGAPRVNMTVRQGANWYPDVQNLWPTTFYRSTAGNIVEVNVLELDARDEYGLLGGGRNWFQTGHNQGYQADVSGGSDQVTYYGSLDWDRQEGVVSYNWKNQLSGRANLSYTPNEQLKLDFSLGAVRSRMESSSAQQPLPTAIIWSCPAPGCEPGSGLPNALDGPYRGYIAYLPEVYEDEIEGFQDVDRTTFSLAATHNPFGFLTHRLTVGGDFGNNRNTQLYKACGCLGTFQGFGSKEIAETRNTFITVDYQASSTYSPFESLGLTTSGGLQFYKKQQETNWSRGEQFPVRALETISSGSTRNAQEDFVENRTFGVFFQEQLAWDNKLFLTGAVRGDDNSAFGENFDFVVYPKLSASYVISDEGFFQDNVGFINQLKLRAAWGKAGRQPDVFDAIRTYEPAVGPGGTATLTPSTIGNPDLQPEVGSELEIGFDASFVDDRVGLEFTYFDQTTTDAIVAVPVAPSLGFPNVQFRNIGEVTNKGYELSLNANVFRAENMSVDLGATYSKNENEVVDLGGQPPIVQSPSQGQFHVEGFPIASVFFKKVVSSTVVDGVASNVMCEGGELIPGTNLSRGGGAPVPCATAPSVYWGQPVPTNEGSVYATITLFGDLQIFGLVDWLSGRIQTYGDIAAQHRFFINSRAILEATDPILMGYAALGGQGLWQSGIIDAGFAKLRTVSASYALPESFANRVNASRMTVTLQANNLATLWKGQDENFGVKVVDTEIAQQVGGATQGLSVYNQEGWPQMTSFMATVRVTF